MYIPCRSPAIGALSDRARGLGQSPGFADIIIAATAQHHGLTILSRNPKAFRAAGRIGARSLRELAVNGASVC
jgi:predicted nucleic acid-binding protein